jgi:RimJ/RimL family protein N-acetyltransferase
MIETRRLLLRPFVADDWRALLDIMSIPDVVRYLPWEPFEEYQAREFVQEATVWDAGSGAPNKLALCLKPDGRLVGTIFFEIFSAKYRTREVGYVLHPDFQGQGCATEAAEGILEYAFEALGLHRMIATCDPRNAASCRVMEKLGMRREAHFQKDVIIHGKWADEYFYAILEEEWMRRQN